MRVALVALLGLVGSGCAQIFGIDNTTGPDAAADLATMQWQRMSIGGTVVKTPLDLTGQTATYLAPSTTDPSGYTPTTATQSAVDTWSANLAGTPALETTLPDLPTPIRRLIALPNRHVQNVFVAYEHPNPQPAPAGAQLVPMITLPTGYVSTESFQILEVGTWAYHGFTTAELPAPNVGALTISTTIPYATPQFNTSLTNNRPLEAIANGDAVLVLRYVGQALTGFADLPGFAQTGNDPLTGTIQAVTNNATLDVTVQPTRPGMRFAAVRPATANLTMGWTLNAAPGYLIGSSIGPQLNQAVVLGSDSGVLNVPYANPFIGHGWNTVFDWGTFESRSYLDPATSLPATLSASMRQWVEPAAGLVLDLPAGLPITISVNQTALVSDGLTITLDATKAVDVTMMTDQSNCTLYTFAVLDLLPNQAMPPTALVGQTRYATQQTTPTIKIPPGVFEATHLYTIRATCELGGYPSLMDGNLQSRMLPHSYGLLDSGAFKVMFQ
jgi:hypothetical protein